LRASGNAFDLEGIAVSSGAACSSGKVQPSRVLAAVEISPALVRGAVRMSLGWSTGQADVERFLAARGRLANALCRGHSITA
jgi:cysteine desulfurase